MTTLPPLFPILYEPLVRATLAEDLGRAGDLTSDSILPPDLSAVAFVMARRAGRVAGLDVAISAFRLLDPRIEVQVRVGDGSDASAQTVLAEVRGPARAVLAAERTALNFLGHLSGIATVTRDVVERVSPWGARVACTRKTTPGLRTLEKYAVRAGGGSNHRYGLDDAILIKDNHRSLAGGVKVAVERARAKVGHLVKIEVEVESLEQLAEALEAGVDVVLLDNMTIDEMKAAVALGKGRVVLEASGGITPDNAAAIASTGVDVLSLGWLTHSAPNLDVALDVQI
jgi:nicotinate-nucleotide pyrophosphorylase (carboxylating)